MISWLRENAQRAGLKNSKAAALFACLAVLAVFALVQDLLSVLWLSLASALGVAGLLLESLAARARKRGKLIGEEWPTVIEALESAAMVGMPLLESLRDLADSSHLLVAKDFAWLCDRIDSGASVDQSLAELKSRFGLANCDLTIETLRLVHEAGGSGFQAALSLQAKTLRQRTSLLDQLVAKQGWVTSTAKVAVAAPWLIVALLSFRQENASAYNTAAGQLLLAAGLLASFLALRLIALIGRIDLGKRVFA